MLTLSLCLKTDTERYRSVVDGCTSGSFLADVAVSGGEGAFGGGEGAFGVAALSSWFTLFELVEAPFVVEEEEGGDVDDDDDDVL